MRARSFTRLDVALEQQIGVGRRRAVAHKVDFVPLLLFAGAELRQLDAFVVLLQDVFFPLLLLVLVVAFVLLLLVYLFLFEILLLPFSYLLILFSSQ